MGKTYLFSPVGNTDPIKYLRDGSLLHICRHYKPDVIYLYLSKEMLENHEKDNRYVKTLELLGEKLDHTFEVYIRSNAEMCEVQQYDLFYTEFGKMIGEIEQGMEKDDILFVNMASGTPAMKSALLVMATLTEYRFRPIQVSTPKKKSNEEHEERKEYDVMANWELDEDNEEGYENRCQEIKCMNLLKMLKIDIIEKHLCAYDYQAAWSVGKEIRKDISPIAYQWLETAAARAMLDWEKMARVLPKRNGILKTVNGNDKKRVLFEYTLALDLKLKRGEYADFLRAITPLGVDLLEMVLERFCGVDIERYYCKKRAVEWDKKALQGTEIQEILDEAYKHKQGFRGGVVYSSHLNAIVKAKCSDVRLANRVQELVEVEQKVRNIAAHQIVSVTPEWIKEKTGKSTIQIMDMIKSISEKVEINTKKEYWRSYDVMNDKIIEALNE